MKDKVKQILNGNFKDRLKMAYDRSGYLVLFAVSFLFFLYLTFPYGVLKESISSTIGKKTGIDIRMGELSPSFPLGFDLENIKISLLSGGPVVELQEVVINISILNLLIGKLAVTVDLVDDQKGELETTIKFSIFDMIFSKNFIPSRILVASDKFAIGSLVNFGMNFAVSDPNNPTGQMIAGLFEQINIVGKLDGKVDFNLTGGDLALSSGNIDLKIIGAEIKLHPSLEMENQKFSKALIRASMIGGDLNFAKDSGFHTQELFIDLSGNFKLKQSVTQSMLNLAINLKLEKGMKDKFGFLLNAKGGVEGEMKISIKGTMAVPNVITS